MTAPEHQVVIVGAGSAGLAAALCLSDLAVRSVVVDRGRVAASWRTRYDGLQLNTGREVSHLPKRRYVDGTPPFPSRDDVVAHLEEHSGQRGIELRLDTTVEQIVRRRPSGWGVVTADGIVDAAHVVVATGAAHTPQLPSWPGAASFTGQLLHSSDYRRPAPYAGRRVVVVGTGSSGLEIARELATGGAGMVWLSVRTPPNLVARTARVGRSSSRVPPRWADAMSRRARVAAFGDLTEVGLPMPADGPFSRARRLHVAPTLIAPEVVDPIRDRSVEVVAAVTELDGAAVVLADGSRLDADVVIAATGYRSGLEPLVGHLGVLGEDGVPTAGGHVAAAVGLWFLGFPSRPLLIADVSRQAERMAGRIAREIAEASRPKGRRLF